MQISPRRLAAAAALALFSALPGCGHSDEPAEASGMRPAFPALKLSPAAALIGSPLTATDGTDALRQLTLAYRGQASFQAHMHADIRLNFGSMREIPQDTDVLFSQLPARALLHVSDPVGGSNDYFADGRNLVHFRGMVNRYQRRVSPAGLAEITSQIDKDAPLLLNPLSFATTEEKPSGIESARLLPDEKIDGRPMAVVSGELSAKFAARIAGPLLGWEAPVKERSYRLWIDRANSIIRKSEVRLSWLSQGRNTSTFPLPPNPTVHIVERTEAAQFCVPIKTDDFRFTPPTNAKEVFTPFP